MEYILKLKKGENLKILSKRYSDLHQFHQTLAEQTKGLPQVSIRRCMSLGFLQKATTSCADMPRS